MATHASNASDGEDINDFLRRIKELGEQRDREDEERTRKLEEEILAGRREREARRAERARSISPQKTTPTASPTSTIETSNARKSRQLADPPVSFSPPPPSPQSRDPIMGTPNGSSRDKARSQATSPTTPTSSKAGSLGRSGTLSWQQRPSSRDSNSSRQRPLSSLAIENAAARAASTPPKQSPTEDADMSRTQIATSLAMKDPSWFRQTADRGLGSAAYRKNQEDMTSDNFSSSGNMRLPGMSRDSTTESEKSPDIISDNGRSSSPSRLSQTTAGIGNRYPSISSVSSAGQTPQLPTSSSQRFEPPQHQDASGLSRSDSGRLAMSPSQGQLGTERPPSPTKGLGGFVQSAMMKRSDSVKRWSAQPPIGLSRGNSIASNRNSVHGLGVGLDAIPKSPPEKRPRVISSTTEEDVKLTASGNTDTVIQDVNGDAPSEVKESPIEPVPNPVTRRIPASTSSRSLPTRDRSDSAAGHGSDSVPTSPSKTMDPRRWSPTKSTWLESALNKSDSPRVKSPPPQQPSWMSEIQKTKQAKAEGEELRSPKVPFREIETAGLMRSPPVGGHSRPLSISGLPEGWGPSFVRSPSPTKPLTEIKERSKPEPSTRSDSHPKVEYTDDRSSSIPKELPAKGEGESPGKKPAPPETTSDSFKEDYQETGAKAPEAKPSPKPEVKPKTQVGPAVDLRAGLKPRASKPLGTSSDQPEFKNVFGNLKRAQTKNYVAPDVLKDNITRGKAALNTTGGPKKTARVDEFKESILKQKEAMKTGSVSLGKKGDAPPGPRKPSSSIPEALAKRDNLTRSDTSKAVSASEPVERPAWKARTTSQEKPIPDVSKETIVPAGLKWSERQALLKKSASNSAPIDSRQVKSESSEAPQSKIVKGRALVAEPASFAPVENTVSKASTNSSGGGSGSKLADRLNPALLGILSRGPSPRQDDAGKSTEDLPSKATVIDTGGDAEASGAALTHMTKGRAKGPKRRAPNSAKTETKSDVRQPQVDKTSESVSAESEAKKLIREAEAPAKRAKPSPRPLADLINNNEKIRRNEDIEPKTSPITKVQEATVSGESLSPSISCKPKPKVAAKSPEVRRVSSQILQTPGSSPVSPVTPSKENIAKTAGEEQMEPQTPVSARLAGWATVQQERSILSTPSKAEGGTPRGPRLPPAKSSSIAKSAAEPAGRAMLNKQEASGGAKKTATPIPATAPGSITAFFHTPPTISSKVDVDPQDILVSNKVSAEKVQTSRSQISSITGDGKTIPLPSDQEYILHGDQMYVVIHDFSHESQTSRKETEVYLWTGPQVSGPSIEDAQLFCRKIAREHSAKVQHVPFGKETSRFLSALGGVGVFRDNSQKAESSFYMLRARRHLSHVTFDEVPFSATSLCSGFCYIVSAKFGKLWIWKGKGAAADELGTARLIGMNLSLLGEIEEVAEGEEPDNFFESFPAGTMKSKNEFKTSSVHWGMKARNENYSTRLFKVDHSPRRPSSAGGGLGSLWARRGSSPAKAFEPITEVMPFNHSDLKEDAIFILDAWFEIYVFVPSHSKSKSSEFSTAVHFAQEYSILSVSLQDRPLMPAVKVLLGGTTRDFRLCFRFWDETVDEKMGLNKDVEKVFGVREVMEEFEP